MTCIETCHLPKDRIPGIGITPALVAKILASCFVSFKPMGPKLGPAGKIDWLSMQILG